MICPNCKEEIKEEDESERIMGTFLRNSYCSQKCSKITYYIEEIIHLCGRIFYYEISDRSDSERIIVLHSTNRDPYSQYLSCPKTSLYQITEKDSETGIYKSYDYIMKMESFLPFSSQEEFNNLIPRLLKLKAFS